jgi:hypothetical protein
MTDDEARAVLQSDDFHGWIGWDEVANRPHWAMVLGEYTICLDGDFSEKQLLALLHFKPAQA